MARMTGGEALARQLAREGVSVIFGVPGVQLYGVMAGLRDEGRIRFVTTRHEQSTSYMADGYARAGGAFGTALVVPGPGLLNAAAGLSTAYAASSPVLMLSGQVPRASLGRHVGVLHEVHDQLDCIAPVTKWRRRVLEVRDVPAAVHEAVEQLRTGRPRPVELEVPPDTMEEEGDAELVAPSTAERAAAAAADVDRAAALLLAARRPAIYAGGGAVLSDAHEALTAVAEYLQAAVVTSFEGRGAVSDASDLSVGAALWPGSRLRAYLDGCDVILAVGTRLAVAGLAPTQQVVHLDVDPAEIGRTHANSVGLVGDARRTLLALLERLRAAEPPRPSRKAEREALRAAIARDDDLEPQSSILKSLRAGLPEDAVFVGDMTQIGYYARPFWPVWQPRTFFTSSYSGNLGYAYPFALGAKVACPRRPVVAVCGDGGFMYNAQELATAVQEKIGVVVVVFDDGAYGNVARDLDEAWGGAWASRLHNPDFVRFAESFGVTARRAAEPAEVGRLVRDAVQLDRPVLIHVPCGRMPRPHFFAPRRAPAKYRAPGRPA
jgi:acetolactate synthase-1/2/3 large subunit